MTDYVVTAKFDDGSVAAGADAATAALNSAAAAGETVNASVVRVGPSAQTLAKQFDDATKSAAALAAAQRALTSGANTMADAIAKGTVTQAQAAAVVDGLTAKVNSAQAAQMALATGAAKSGAALEASAAGAETASAAHAGFYREVLVLGHEIVSGNYNRIPGSIMVLAERTGNLENIAKSAFAALTSVPGMIAIAAVAGVAAVGQMIYAAESQQLAVDRLRNSLALTRSDYMALADTVSAVAKQEAATPGFSGSTADAKTAAQTIAAVPTFSGSAADLQGMLDLANKLAIAMGQTVPEAAQTLAAGLRDPTAEAKKLAGDGFASLDAATVETITHLQAIGETSQASGLLMDALRDSTAGVTQNITPLQQALQNLDVAFGNSSAAAVNWKQTLGTVLDGIATGAVNAAASAVSSINSLKPDFQKLNDDRRAGQAASQSGYADSYVATHNSMAYGFGADTRTAGPDTGQGYGPLNAGNAQQIAANNNQVLSQANAASSGGAQAMRDQITLLKNAEGLVDSNSDAWKRYQDQIDKDQKSLDNMNKTSTTHQDDLTKQIALLNITTASDAALTQAYLAGNGAVATLTASEEAKKQAEKDFPKSDTDRALATIKLTQAYQDQAIATSDLKAAESVDSARDTLTTLQTELSLVGETADARAHDLAVLKERQSIIKAAGGDEAALDTAAAQAAVDYAGRVADATSALQHQQQVVSDLTGMATQAFDQVGQGIANAFTSGSGSAVNFGNIFKSVIASVLEQLAKLAIINPIMNSLLGTTSTTLNDVSGILGSMTGGSGGAVASSGGSSLSSLSSVLGLSKLTGVDIGQSLGLTGPGGILSTSLWSGTLGASDVGASALYGGGAQALGIGAGAGVSVGSLLGGVGVGFGAGSLLGSLIGNNSTGGEIGSGVGSLAGAAIGSIVPGIGTILGGLLGGVGGDLLGGLIGPGPSSHGWTQDINVQPDGSLALGNGGFDKFDGTQILTQLQTEIASLNSTMSAFGINANPTTNVNAGVHQGVSVGGVNGGFTAGQDWGVDLNDPKAFSQLRFGASDANLNSALAGRSFQGTADLQEFSTLISQTIPALMGSGAVGTFTDQVTALNTSFSAAIAESQKYGVATDGLVTAWQAQVASVQNTTAEGLNEMANGWQARIAAASGTPGGTLNANLINFDISAQQQRDQLTAQLTAEFGTAYTATTDYATAMGGLNNALDAERAALVATPTQQAQGAATSAVTSLASYAQGLVGGTANPASAPDQYSAAQSQFQAVSGAALSGNADSINNLQTYSDTYLNAARNLYGSGAGYASAYQQVMQVLGQIGAMSPTSLTQDFMTQALQTQTDTLSSDLQALRKEVVTLTATVKQGNMMPARLAS